MNWNGPLDVEVPEEVYHIVGGHPLVARRIVSLGLKTKHEICAFFDAGEYTAAEPESLDELEKAVHRLELAIREKEPILVWGDFDVDGQTATSLLVSLLERLGGVVGFYIPLRETESHGLNITKLSALIREGYKVLLTCDTGISSVDEVKLATKAGLDVIITDHHDLPAVLPEAYAIVNPKFLVETHPMSGLPGVGVAYQLSRLMHSHMGSEKDAAKDLDLVALGIVADLATVTGDVRYLLQKGLEKLRRGGRAGIDAMLERMEVDSKGINEEFIAFSLAPRLNALGRLGDANPAVDLLTTDDIGHARILVTDLESMNERRKQLTKSIYQGIESHITQNPSLVDKPAIVMAGDGWHTGVIGIVASRLVEQYGKPVVLISKGHGEIARGSARSVAGVNISSILEKVKEYLSRYGGHPMAAGFSLPENNIAQFRRAVYREVLQTRISEAATLDIDAQVPLHMVDLNFLDDINRLAPFGPGNPVMVYSTENLEIIGVTTIGVSEEHYRLDLLEKETEKKYSAIWWRGGSNKYAEENLVPGNYDLAYQAKLSYFTGQAGVSIEVVDVHRNDAESGGKQVYISRDFIDYRNEPHPISLLQLLVKEKGVLVWAEAEARKELVVSGIPTRTRLELDKCKKLVIWTIPPERIELLNAINKSKPEKIILFSMNLQHDQFEPILTALSGLLKFAVRTRGGAILFSQLASELNQREKTVEAGLDWLIAQGFIRMETSLENGMVVSLGGKKNAEAIKKSSLQLKQLLLETSSFRLFFQQTSLESIVSLCNPVDGKKVDGGTRNPKIF